MSSASFLLHFGVDPSPNLDDRVSPVLGLPLPPRGLRSCLNSVIQGLYALSEIQGLRIPLSSATGVPPELVILGLFRRLISPRLLVTMSSRISALWVRANATSISCAAMNGIAGDSSYSAASRSVRCAPLKSFGRMYCLTEPAA